MLDDDDLMGIAGDGDGTESIWGYWGTGNLRDLDRSARYLANSLLEALISRNATRQDLELPVSMLRRQRRA
jgi:hypothetical protein